MPTPEPTLSERLDIWQCEQDHDADSEGWALVKEAVLRLACREAAEQQPEVAELVAKADLRGMQGYPEWAADLRAHIATLVRLAEAEAKVARVPGLPKKWTPRVPWNGTSCEQDFGDDIECANKLDAALGGEPDTTDGERGGEMDAGTA